MDAFCAEAASSVVIVSVTRAETASGSSQNETQETMTRMQQGMYMVIR